jgi:uncharacterized protein YbcI
MTDLRTAGPATVMPGEITKSFASLWKRYAGVEPSDVRTDIRGDTLTCVLVNAVDAFERQIRTEPALADYKREAIETVVRLTRQRVAAFVSSHDRRTDVATEIFKLEPPSPARGGR